MTTTQTMHRSAPNASHALVTGGTAMLDGMIEWPGAGTAVQPEILLERVAQGDQRAFAQLYDLVAARVLGLVKRILRDHAQSEEVTQEIFLELWQSAARFDPNKGGATSWI